MENICGFFDTVGFKLKDGYVPCEISLLSDNGASCLSICHGIHYKDLTNEDKRIIQDEQYENGLAFSDRQGLSLYRITDVLQTFYDVNHDEDRFLIAFCSPEAGELLRKARIPRYNLSKLRVNWSLLNEKYPSTSCFLHSHSIGKRCAFSCVNNMQKWLYHKLKPRTGPNSDVCGYKRYSLAGYDLRADNSDGRVECDCPYGAADLEEKKTESK